MLSVITTYLCFFAFTSSTGFTQDLKTEMLNEQQIEEIWGKFKSIKGGGNLLQSATQKGFNRMTGKEAGWGFKGLDQKGKPVLMCVWTFEPKNNKEKESCAMIMIQNGGKQYLAYMTFPENMKDLDDAKEWFANEQGEVQLAHSWHSCFRQQLRNGSCSARCQTNASHNYCYTCSFVEFYTFFGKVRLFNLNTYMACISVRCAADAACLLSVALGCGYSD